MTSCHKNMLHRLALLLAAIFLLTGTALAQVTTADITGRVLDQNGASVPNASVTVRNTGSGQTRTAQTDEDGNYTVTQLTPGRYEITAEAASFSKAQVKDLEVNIGSKLTLNFDLKPQITESWHHSDSALVNHQSTSGGGHADRGAKHTAFESHLRSLSIIIRSAPRGNFDRPRRGRKRGLQRRHGRQVDVTLTRRQHRHVVAVCCKISLTNQFRSFVRNSLDR